MTYTVPFAGMFPTQALRQVDRLLDEVFAVRPVTPSGSARGWEPAVEAREDDHGFSLSFDVPGVPANQIEVLAEAGTLTVKGTRASSAPGAEERLLFSEMPTGSFARRFRLPKSADLQTVSASHANGVLTVRVGKVAPAQPRRVPVVVQSPSQAVGSAE